MLVRQPQMELLRTETLVRGGEAFVRDRLSDDYRAIGSDTVRDSIRLAVAKCRLYRLHKFGHILRYLNVMYTLGFRFDEVPAYAWAPEILNRHNLSDESRIDLLCARVGHELEDDQA